MATGVETCFPACRMQGKRLSPFPAGAALRRMGVPPRRMVAPPPEKGASLRQMVSPPPRPSTPPAEMGATPSLGAP